MGLDFSLYKKKKDIDVNSFLNDPSINYDEVELAYGRKSWELVHALIQDNNDINEGYEILTLEKWEELMKSMDPIGDLLPRLNEAYDHYEFYLNHYEDDDKDIIDRAKYIFTDEDKKLISKYEYWYEKTFNDSPTLGYEFSVGYMWEFYKAKDKVREVLKDPDYEVLMIISY